MIQGCLNCIKSLYKIGHWHLACVWPACCGIEPWMLRHPSCVFSLPIVFLQRMLKAYAIACCGLLFSYMFQCLGILPSMLRHTPCVFPSCCSIEMPLPWINMHINQCLPQKSQKYWFSLILTCFPFFNQQSYAI